MDERLKMKILVINSGSSSIKYQLFDMDRKICLAKGVVDRIGMEHSSLSHSAIGGKKYTLKTESLDYKIGLKLIMEALAHPEHGVIDEIREISAVGHRVVHGAEKFTESVLITDEMEATIKECFPLAPLHNPPNLMSIQACKDLLPDIPHIAVFDTAFHQSMPEYAYLYAIPYELYKTHSIRRYGFHGTSHRYVAARASEILDKPSDSIKMVTCHLGNGCSMAAISNGRSVDTSMGFTPLEGLVMGTRSGDLDPAVVFFLHDSLDIDVAEIDELLNKKSGLLGISGVSNDVRDIFDAAEKGNPRAKLALEIFCYRVRKYIGAYAAAMGGIDAVIFTAGIGENSPELRKMICQGLEFFGIKIDDEKNRSAISQEKCISRENSPVKIFVIPTNEELMIAQDTFDVVLKAPQK